MKNKNNIFARLFGALAIVAGMTACQDNVDAPVVDIPVANIEANTSILDLKKAFWNDAVNYIDTIGVKSDGSHYVIKGRVVSTDEPGNVFKSLVIQDESAALAISINSYNLYLKYRRGQEVVLDLTGMYIGKYNGLQQLGMPEWYENGNAWEATFMSPEFFQNHVQLNGLPEVAKVDTIAINTFAELPTDPAGLMKWQSQLVRLNNIEFVNGGKETFSTYHSSGVNQGITDADGSTLQVRTSGYSNFWNQTLPDGRGDLVCILSYYGTTGWQLIMLDADGCMNFGNPTVAPGTETKPWTVDEAVAIEAGGQSKSGWVTGYIVGAVAPEVTEVKSNSDVEWTSTPILANTLVIGQTPDTKDITHAVVIELPAGSALRQYGNLVDNPGNYQKQIWVRANLEKYLGTYGLTGNNGSATTFKIDGVEIGGTGIANGDGTKASPYSSNQVISGVGTGTTAWVAGYIVGSSVDKAASDFKPGAEGASNTNIFIANTPDETDYTKCVPVQLPAGDVRSALSLQANPGLIGMKVAVLGSLEKYFGQPGVKTVTEYVLDGTVTPPTPPTPTEGDGTEANPYTVSSVIAMNPQSTTDPVASGVWVKGYIVGWANTSASPYTVNASTAIFNAADVTLATNILVADAANVTDFTKCIAVQLPAGDVRSALNLQANPGNLGKAVSLKGDVMKYSGVPGLRNTSDYKLDGTDTPPTPPTPGEVTSLNENFDTSTSIPAGWTSYKIAGDKEWYIANYSGNNYASMTGYKGTAPFDSWLVTPGIDMSKVTDKVLTFETEVNGYGSTTSTFEVFVLTDADPAKATQTRLNVTLPTAPASGYSSWVSSGNIDLSAYTGVIYIGFRYAATADANYATWCVDNVKLNAGGGSSGGDDPVTPPTPSGDYKGDFNSFNGGQAKASPYGTYTNATGWTATNSIVLGGGDKDANPIFTFIGPAGTLAPTLNGKVGASGTLTSPVLSGGIGTLTFSYGFAFSESKAQFTVYIKDKDGKVLKTDVVTLDTIAKGTAYSYSLDVDVAGDFIIDIVNNSYSASTSNKDRVSIWNLTWSDKK